MRQAGSRDPVPLTPQSPLVARAVKAAGWMLLVGAVVMVPWTVYLATTLPRRVLSEHYALAWAGFDVMLCLSLLATSVSILRRGGWLPALASSTATFLFVDAWFDVVTAPTRSELRIAAASALFVELPTALACVLISLHAQAVSDARAVEAARHRLRRFLRSEHERSDHHDATHVR